MKQILTKEEAIMLFRQMWTDMQTELGDCPDATERLDFKREWCDKNLPDMHVQNYCPLCEYVEGLHRTDSPICRFCPIDWPGTNCFNMSSINYYENPISEILALPEREVPDDTNKII